MLFWNLFIQAAVFIAVAMLIGAAVSGWARARSGRPGR